jgi:type VI secretion system protein ImpG
MADSLQRYFNQELDAVRQMAAEFTGMHPEQAERLRMSADTVDDPHVARLLDGVAFLSARAQQRLDDEFPELTDTLLGILYPHYLAPFPSCAIAQFTPKTGQQARVDVPAGFELDTAPVHGQTCRFRTSSPLTLWPLRVDAARLSGLPLVAPLSRLAQGAAAVLRLTLTTQLDLNGAKSEVKFSQLGLDKLRLFLAGSNVTAMPLYELLAAHCLGIALANSPNDPNPVLLPASAIQPAGFAPEDALLPWPARSFTGFRLLSEYSAFPKKFLFLDLVGLAAKTMVQESTTLEIFIYLDRTSNELERAVSAENFAIGCTPIVNLFAQHCEPVAMNHGSIEYRLIPDTRRSNVMEIWSIENVREVKQDATSRRWRPFYRLRDLKPQPQEDGGFYHERRRDAAGMAGTDLYLTLFEAGFDPEQKIDSVLAVEALCLNRDLPADLPFGGGHPVLKPLKPHNAVQTITCLTKPTSTQRRELRAEGAWRLISHLSLGHLSVTGGTEGAAALKEILRLYDTRNASESRVALEALLAVHAKPGTARVPGARPGAFCRGLDVTLEFEPRVFQSAGLYLLSAVLERFLALHATVNSFVRTTVALRGKPEPEVRFPARAGARVLL